ncbi:MAG: hypothetical protein EZS28_054894 [Streblomastix strix]|uniref:Uncharacterized protein n=1 Tax=Streblomastix strix TaxID=222440 RepID=A0A5J4QCS0_9EUKA|nr:MAG: hypothetical protein EZS28_054894 [Streblomastix strix]
MTQAGEELAVAFHLSVVASRALETWRIFATERRDLRDKTFLYSKYCNKDVKEEQQELGKILLQFFANASEQKRSRYVVWDKLCQCLEQLGV